LDKLCGFGIDNNLIFWVDVDILPELPLEEFAQRPTKPTDSKDIVESILRNRLEWALQRDMPAWNSAFVVFS
jgi:hypothetical protein